MSDSSPTTSATTVQPAPRKSKKSGSAKKLKRSKDSAALSTAPAETPEAPTALRKSASWCLSQLDSAIRSSVQATLARTNIEALSLRGYWVLEAIADGLGMAQTELSAVLGMDRSDMVRLIDNLEKSGLVTRTRDRNDRRRQLISLTDEGETARVSLRRSLRRAERAAIAGCSAEVRTLLASLADDSTAPASSAEPEASATALPAVPSDEAGTAATKAAGEAAKDVAGAPAAAPDSVFDSAPAPADAQADSQQSDAPKKKSKKKKKVKKKKKGDGK
nr:MarR family winged helix-turn-helix transcriptional regulator [Corynebacterium lactis]